MSGSSTEGAVSNRGDGHVRAAAEPAEMTALTRSRYGGPDVLEVASVPRPTPGPDEVLLDVRATSINAGDYHLLRGRPLFIRLLYGGLLQPDLSILGMDVAGTIEAVGTDVTDWEAGDSVLANVSEHGHGGFAEFVSAPERALVGKPAAVSFEDAAALPTAGVTARQGLRDDGQLEAGDEVLINGASGGVGTFAVQIAKTCDADVTGVCRTEKVDAVRSIGADRVLDYTREDVTAAGRRYDVILDTAAAHSLRDYRRLLHPGGRYVMVGGPAGRFLKTMALGPVVSRLGNRHVGTSEMEPAVDDLAELVGQLVDGDLTPVVDRTYPPGRDARGDQVPRGGTRHGKAGRDDGRAGGLRPTDELLLVCDRPDDPVAAHDDDDLPPTARLVVAGDPEGCSGKANAIAAGMERATHDRIVWTDDDFHHPPGWLATMKADYERQGPTTEVPVFVGRDPLAWLLEPSYATSTALASAGLMAWGGALVFDREDVNEERLLRDLRRTINDDATLGEHVDFTGASRTRRVGVGGTIRDTLERHTRFMQASLRHGGTPWLALAALTTLLAVGFVRFPLVGVAVATLGYAAIYAILGIRRWTLLLAYPATVLGPLLIVYGLARRTFVWGGRRYRWRSMFDVEIVE